MVPFGVGEWKIKHDTSELGDVHVWLARKARGSLLTAAADLAGIAPGFHFLRERKHCQLYPFLAFLA